MYVADVIREAIYDGPFDQLGYSYQPVILEKMPSLADGDAVIQAVVVSEGDIVVNSAGQPEELRPGVVVRPAGCHDAACAVTYEAGEIEMEQMEATFHLRETLAWADGTPLTADDSVYSYELYWDPQQYCNSYRPEVNPTAHYQALDARTIVWTGLPGHRDPDYATRFWQPLPRHVLGHLSAREVCEADLAGRTPLGYGPFTTREWVPGQHLVVERNPHYFRADEGLPYFDQVVFRFVGKDPEITVPALLDGQCDLLTMDMYLEGSLEQLLELNATDQLRLYATTTNVWERLDFGIDPAGDYAGTRPDFFEDVRLRQAVAYCLDRQGVIEQLLFGLSTVPHTYVSPDHPLADPEARQYPYSPEQGMALLDELGWRDEDGDGIRECRGCGIAADGTPLSFTWSSSQAAQRANAMALLQANLRQCGFDVTLENLPAGEWFADPPEGPLFGRRFDLAATGAFAETVPGCWTYLCSEIPGEENGWEGANCAGFCSQEYDQACRAALQTLPGTPEYELLHGEAQRIFAQELPSVPLFLRLRIFAARPDLLGLAADPTEYVETWNIEEFSLEP
jgi:peptide/nickel transport system substrate-binding protein